MRGNLIGLDYSALDEYRKKLEALGGDATKQAFNDALKASQSYVAEQAAEAMKKHNDTGRVSESIVDNTDAEWTADSGQIPVGFSFKNGGLPSVFLMRGTKVYGQPHIKPDRKLYNAVYGKKTKEKVLELQRQALGKAIREAEL